MARPNRKTVDAWYDVFADMDPEEQAVAMKVLEQTHRLAQRTSRKAAPGVDTLIDVTSLQRSATPAAGDQIPLREPGQ
jgi:hypothetical protein